MLRLWPNRLNIALSSKGFYACLQNSLGHKRIEHRFDFSNDDSTTSDVMSALGRWLATQPIVKQSDVNIVLSSAYVRYQCLPYISQMRKQDEVVYAKAALIEIYGELAQSWKVVCDHPPVGEVMLVAGVEASLLASLEVLVKGCNATMKSVMPSLMPIAMYQRNALINYTGVFALLCEELVILVWLEAGLYRDIETIPNPDHELQRLKVHIERQAILKGIEHPQIILLEETTNEAWGNQSVPPHFQWLKHSLKKNNTTLSELERCMP